MIDKKKKKTVNCVTNQIIISTANQTDRSSFKWHYKGFFSSDVHQLSSNPHKLPANLQDHPQLAMQIYQELYEEQRLSRLSRSEATGNGNYQTDRIAMAKTRWKQ